jgi:hypothetical protein
MITTSTILGMVMLTSIALCAILALRSNAASRRSDR